MCSQSTAGGMQTRQETKPEWKAPRESEMLSYGLLPCCSKEIGVLRGTLSNRMNKMTLFGGGREGQGKTKI